MQSALSLLRIGVDLDGVLNNLGETMLRDCQSRGWAPAEMTMDDITEYQFEKAIPGLTGEMVWEQLKVGHVFENACPNYTAREVLDTLGEQGAKVHIVTSRNFSQRHRKLTEGWLREHGFRYHRLGIYDKTEKAAYAEAHQLDIFIEDHLPTAVWMADIVRCSIILDRPYNRYLYPAGDAEPEPSNLIRMFSWSQIAKFFMIVAPEEK